MSFLKPKVSNKDNLQNSPEKSFDPSPPQPPNLHNTHFKHTEGKNVLMKLMNFSL